MMRKRKMPVIERKSYEQWKGKVYSNLYQIQNDLDPCRGFANQYGLERDLLIWKMLHSIVRDIRWLLDAERSFDENDNVRLESEYAAWMSIGEQLEMLRQTKAQQQNDTTDHPEPDELTSWPSGRCNSD